MCIYLLCHVMFKALLLIQAGGHLNTYTLVDGSDQQSANGKTTPIHMFTSTRVSKIK